MALTMAKVSWKPTFTALCGQSAPTASLILATVAGNGKADQARAEVVSTLPRCLGRMREPTRKGVLRELWQEAWDTLQLVQKMTNWAQSLHVESRSLVE